MDEATPALGRWARINFLLALLVLGIFPVAALGSRTGLWDFRGAFSAIKVEAFLGTLAVVSSIVLLLMLRKRRVAQHRGLTWVSLILVIVALTPLLIKVREATQLPPIHDITTHFTDVPLFSNAVSLRPEGSNSLEYGGNEVARQQKSAYPGVAPIATPLPPAKAFREAERIARDLGWQIAHADESTGTIEATETSTWFGFVDDIVIRIRPDASGSRIDLRSVSRVGVSDIGANAARILRFTKAFQAASTGS